MYAVQVPTTPQKSLFIKLQILKKTISDAENITFAWLLSFYLHIYTIIRKAGYIQGEGGNGGESGVPFWALNLTSPSTKKKM